MASFITLETGEPLLLETGGVILLEESTYSPIPVFGSNLKVYLNADSLTGVDSDAVTAMTNQGTAAGFEQTVTSYQPTLKIISSKKIIRHDGTDVLSSTATIAAMSTWTFYAVARPTTQATGGYFVSAGSGINIIISGYVAGKWEYYDNPRTQIADIDTVNFQIVKNTVGSTSSGAGWVIGAQDTGLGQPWTGDWKIIIAIDRALTTQEATDIEAWLATYL